MIYQLDLEGKVVAKYQTLTEAANASGALDTNIRAAINGRRQTAGSFKWSEQVPKKGKIKPRRLFFDIETSPNTCYVWRTGRKQWIGYENLITEGSIICVCYKWEGEKEVHGLTWGSKQSDREILEQFIPILNSADEIIGQNSDKFDLPWLRTRCLKHGIPMFPKYVSTDTLTIARNKFNFNSNRLDYMAKFLGSEGKKATTFDLWKDIVERNDKKALNYMVEYCKSDVLELEKVYKAMKNHIDPKQHYNMLYNSVKLDCPECGSEDLRPVATRTTPAGTVKRRFVCGGCGKYHEQTVRVKK